MFYELIRRFFASLASLFQSGEVRRRSHYACPQVESLENRMVLTFVAPVNVAVGSNPAGIAVGDFNKDGLDDMAVVNNAFAGSVSVLISNGTGTFQAGTPISAGANTVDAAAGDFNGDGKLDLAVVGSALDILLGNGDGTFAAPQEFAAAPTAHSIKTGDFNNDGKLDVGTMNYGSASVFLGGGDGTLQARQDVAVAGNNINLVVGDFNRDGKLDMATSNTTSVGTISVLNGRGDGSFDAPRSYYAFSAPVYLATGDFNHDGYLDFACPNSYAATSMSIVMNNGDGTYAAPHTYGIAQTGYEIEVADFNNDGNDDFAVRGASQYMISLGKGDGTFYPSVNFATPSGRFEAGTHGDFNGDGAVDLAYPTTGYVTVVGNANADIQNLAGAVSFVLSAPATSTSGSVLPLSITAVDAEGRIATGFRGAVVISSSDPAASIASGYAFNPLDAGVTYVFNAADAGTHTFAGAVKLVTAGDQTITVAAPNMQQATTTVNVTGQVTRLGIAAPTNVVAGDTFQIVVSAIDTTGAVATNYSSIVHFTSSDGLAGLPTDYTFTPEDGGQHTFTVTLLTAGAKFVGVGEVGGTIRGGVGVNVAPQVAASLTLAGASGAIGVARPITIVAHDVYGNVATGYNGSVQLTSSDPNAEYPAEVTLINGTATVNVRFLTVGTQTVTATDSVDGSITGTISSDATPPVAALFNVAGTASLVAGTNGTFTVTAIDTIGQIATGFTGTVYFSSSDVQAGLPAAYTFTAADAGVHVFSVALRTAGLQSIRVQDAFGSLVGSQAGIDVAAADFAKFDLSVPNGADSKGHILVTAGDVISLTVVATDRFGNAISSYTGTVHLTSTDAIAGLPADYTFTAADGGKHTFAVDLRTVTPNGVVWSFGVVDVANTTTLVTKTNFEVVNASAASFKLTLPANIVAGSPFTSRVTVLDVYGNTVKNYFGTVHFTSTALNAGLPLDYQFSNVDSGVHEFSLTLNTSGSQTVTLVDAQNGSVLGSEIGTVAASVAKAFLISSSGSAVAGATQSITVSAVDQFGNISTSYRGSVAFSSSDVQAGLPANYTFANKDSGVHAFSVTLKTAGVQTVSVVDLADGTVRSLASTINVKASATVGSFVVSSSPAATAGNAQAVTVQVKDIYGNLTDAYLGTVAFSSSDVQAGLPTAYTFTAADRGTHTFAVTLKTAGTQSISVRDSANLTAVGSQTGIVVSASSVAASFSVQGFAASTTAGANQSFVVTARDAFGNVCTTYTGTIVFGSSDAKAGLPVAYTFTAADRGVHTFSAALKTAGTQQIFVTDAATGKLSGSQTGILVTAGAAANFSLAVSTAVTQSSGFRLTVTVLDAYGNIVTGYRGKIRLSSTDASAGTVDYTFGSKDNGVATLSYKLGVAGLQTLKVTDLADASVVGMLSVNVQSKK
jgi:hypothetical protein